MRIENEQRIMYNSRLEMLGASNTFSVNNFVTLPQVSPDRDPLQVIEYDDSSDLDSIALMNQYHLGGGA
jgi:hypothetical protein